MKEYEMVSEGIDEDTGYVYKMKATAHEIGSGNSGRAFKVDFLYRHQYDDVDMFIVHICGGLRASDRVYFIQDLESEGVPWEACIDASGLVFNVIYKVEEGGEPVETDVWVTIELLGIVEERWFGWTPASQEAVDKLERVAGEGEPCVVCLDDISSSSSAIKLPCSHVFHGDCVLSWLNNNSVCPLCRFNLATHDSQHRLQH